MIDTISVDHLKYLTKSKINLNHYLILKKYESGLVLPENRWVKELCRLGMLLDDKLTDFGKRVVEGFDEIEFNDSAKSRVKQTSVIEYDPRFESWWELFPRTSYIEAFGGMRSLRNKKDKCQEMYLSVLNKGVFTHTDMMELLELEVTERIRESAKRGTNLLEFMSGTHAYLNNEKYLDMVKRWQRLKLNNNSSTVKSNLNVAL